MWDGAVVTEGARVIRCSGSAGIGGDVEERSNGGLSVGVLVGGVSGCNTYRGAEARVSSASRRPCLLPQAPSGHVPAGQPHHGEALLKAQPWLDALVNAFTSVPPPPCAFSHLRGDVGQALTHIRVMWP